MTPKETQSGLRRPNSTQWNWIGRGKQSKVGSAGLLWRREALLRAGAEEESDEALWRSAARARAADAMDGGSHGKKGAEYARGVLDELPLRCVGDWGVRQDADLGVGTDKPTLPLSLF